MMSMSMPILQHLDPVFSPWDSSPPSSEQMGWPDTKILSSSGNVSSSSPSPEEGWMRSSWLDEELSRKLAEKLLELGPLEKTSDERLLTDRLDNVQQQQQQQDKYWSNWGEDYVNQTYRSINPRFKTEICRNFKEKGTCLYGDLCQFAHGNHELRKDVVRHSKYKTKLCQKYWIAGYCAYGPRCNFIHQEIEKDQALRILAGISNEARNGGGVFKATNTDMRRGSSSRTAMVDSGNLDVTLSQMRLSGSSDRVSPFSRSPVDFECQVAELLPTNFGLKEEGYVNNELASRRPIGSERYGRKVEAWSDMWGFQ